MDVQTKRTDFGPDQAATSIGVPAVPSGSRPMGYAPTAHAAWTTAPVPVVRRTAETRDPGHHDRSSPPGWLRIAVAITAFAVLAAGAALIVLDSRSGGGGSPTPKTPAAAASGHAVRHAHAAALLVPTTSGAGTAAYTVSAPTYTVTLATGPNRAWVSVGAPGSAPVFASVLAPATTHTVSLSGPASVVVGAGGTTMTVKAGTKTQTLTPPSAPFTYTLTPS